MPHPELYELYKLSSISAQLRPKPSQAKLLGSDFQAWVTVLCRITDTDLQVPNAYHLMQPTLKCNGRPVVWYGSLNIFLGSEILYSSSINDYSSNLKYPRPGWQLVGSGWFWGPWSTQSRYSQVLKSHVWTWLDINRVHLKFYPILDYFIKVVPDPNQIIMAGIWFSKV